MKKLLLLFCFFIGYFVNAQVGIGTPLPNSSSQLDIVANDRGVLITRVSLTSTTDTATITNGNVESLLVYNTATTSDIAPGYYYWYNNRWNRISVTTDDDDTSNEGFTTDGVDLILTDSNGDFVSIALADLFTETVTSLVDNADGTITYTNEGGVVQTLDIATIVQNGETVTTLTNNGDGTFTYTDESGTPTTINKTQITDNGDGTYTLDSGDGTPITIDTNADVLGFDNSANGFTSTNVQDALEEIQQNLDNTTDILVDNLDGTFTHTAVDGTIVTFDANTTTVTDNGDGTYTITNADGTSAVIDTNAASNPYDSSTSGLTSTNVQGAIDEIVSNIGSGAGVTLVDNADGTVSLIADDGSVLGTVDKTTVTDNGDGTFILDSGNGTPVTIDTNADALGFDNSTNGFTSTNVQDALEEIQQNLDNTTDVLVDNLDGTFTHTAVDGTIVTFDANTTTVTDNGDGTYTITNADGTSAVIDTNAASNPYDSSTSGLTSTNVQEAIDEIVSNIDSGAGVTLADNADGTVSLIADDGTLLGTVDKTTVTDNGDGTFILDSGNGTPVTIDTNADALAFDNSTNGFTSTNVQDALEEIQQNLDNTTDVLVDNGDGTFTHTAVDGTVVTFNANTTTVTENPDGSYTFTDGNGNTITTVETAASTNLFDNSTNGFTSTNVQDALEEIQLNLDNTTDVLVDNGDGTFTHTAVDGTEVIFDANTTTVTDNGDGTYTITNADGTSTVIDTSASTNPYDNTTSGLASGNVQDAIDEIVNNIGSGAGVTLADNADGTVSLIADDGSVLGTVNKTAVTDNGDGTYMLDTGNGTPVSIDTNADALAFDNSTNGFASTNVQDALEEIQLNLDNTTDVLVDNGDGTFTHTAVDGTEVIFDANTTSVTVIDGVYTFNDGAGNLVTTIDTNADAITYDNTTSGLSSDNAQDAIDELSQTIETNKGDLGVSEGIEFTVGTDGINKLLADAGIGIADGGVTTDKLADGAVTNIKVGPDAITNDKLADNAVNTENITDGAVQTADIADDAVTNNKIGADAITTDKITNGEVKAEDLGADIADAGKVGVVQPDGTIVYQNVDASSVDGNDLTAGDGSISVVDGTGATLVNANVSVSADGITNDKLADNAVNTENITDGTITTADLSDGAVSPGKMEAGTINQVMVTNPAGDVEWIDNAALVANNETITNLELNAGALQYTNEDDTNGDVVLISTDANNVITAGTDGALLVDSSLFENIYTTNGTLTEFRTVSGTENWLNFQGDNGTIEINGNNLRSANTTGGITNLYYSGDTARLLSQGSSAELQIGTYDTANPAPLTFGTSEGGGHLSDERMRIAGTGEVGIGTTDPTELLDVAGGNVRVRDINTNTGAATDKLVVADTDGVLKTVSGAMPKFFYMPSIVFDVSTTGDYTKNLHQEYIDQFTGTGNPTLVGSDGAPTDIPNLPTATDLYYYVTYYDTTIFSNVSIDANGVLSYTVNSSAVTAGSFMNIVFVVK